MYYVGIDLHKERSWFYVMDAKGRKVDSKNIPNSPDLLKKYFETIPKPFSLAVETTYNWYFFIDIAENYAQEVYLANSYELKAFAKRNKKTDKIDARLIADVLRKGYLPAVTIPDKETREMKEILRYRMNVIQDQTRNISRLKITLDKLGRTSSKDFSSLKRLEEIPVVDLTESYQEIITGYIERIKHLQDKINRINKFINGQASKDEDIENLVSIPGIGYFSAALIKSEIIDINRFASFGRLCAYAGLAPRIAQSADKTFYGPLNKNRRKNLQWILIEDVHHFIKAVPEATEKFERIKKRKSYNTAKIALARDLLKIIYHILKEKRPFYIEKPSNYAIRSEAVPAFLGV